jgi:uncharacterized membrane protein
LPDKDRFDLIKAYVLVSLTFAIIATIAWAIIMLSVLFSFISLISQASSYYGYISGAMIIEALVSLVLCIVLFVFALIITLRSHEMHSAAKRKDAETLRRLNSFLWAILGIFFGCVVPGIMLFIARGEIDKLGSGGDAGAFDSDSLDKLAKLKSLLDSGAITKNEFNEQKTRITSGFGSDSGSDIIGGQLKRLKDLLGAGAITQKEYDAQKRAILEKM